MNDVLHANIFFVIASIATILFTILICIALYHLIKILRLIRNIMERISAGSEVIAEDLDSIRSFVLDGGLISRLVGMVLGVKQRKKTRSRSKKKTD